jgi:hypothetical protein
LRDDAFTCEPARDLAVQLETELAAMRAVKDLVLTRAEFSGLSGMQQMMKHSNSSSSADSD